MIRGESLGPSPGDATILESRWRGLWSRAAGVVETMRV